MTDRFDDDLRRAARRFAHQPLPDQVLDARFATARADRSWSRASAAIVGGVAVAFAVVIGLGQVGPAAVEPTPTPHASSPIAQTDPPATSSPSSTVGATPMAACATDPEPTPDGTETLVFFGCDPMPNESRAVLRSVGDAGTISDRLVAALEALFDGPTSEEEELGYFGTVPAEWGDIPLTVELLPDGLAILDFDDAILLGSVPNTSAQLGSLNRSISATAFQFSEVTAVELRVRGSCGAFAVWLGEVGQCVHLAEPVEAVSDCPIVEPMSLPSGAPLTPPRFYRNLGGGLSWGSGDDTVTQWVSHRSSISLDQYAEADGAVAIMVGDRQSWAFPDGRELEEGIVRPMIAWDDGRGCVYTAYFAAGASLDDLEQGADRFAGLPHDGPVYAGWWSLRSGERDGQPLPADAISSSLFIDSESLSGRAPCNSYGADIEMDGETISVGQILQTLIGCAGDIEAAETAYLSALSSVTTARIEGGELVFTGPEVELRFHRGALSGRAEGINGDWTLIAGVIEGNSVATSYDRRLTLYIDPDTLGGQAPCNVFGAPIEVADNAIELGPMTSSEVGCPAEVQAAEEVYLGALLRVTTARVEQGHLLLTGPDIELRFAPDSAEYPGG